jgi:MFS family permease
MNGDRNQATPPTRTQPTPRQITRARAAVCAIFFAAGLVLASWASRLFVIRQALSVSPGHLGAILMCISVGSICLMPLTGAAVTRWSKRVVIAATTIVAGVGLTGAGLFVVADNELGTAICLFVMGAGVGPWDVAMNLAGTDTERALGRSVMPQFHAAFSLGTVFAALFGAVLSHAGASLMVHLLSIEVIIAALVAWGLIGLLPESRRSTRHKPNPAADAVTSRSARSRPGASWRAWLEGHTVLIGVVVVAAALAEGSANDWMVQGILQDFSVPESVGILALALFLAAMTGMRMLGTRLIDRHGRVFTQIVCSVLGAAGVLAYALGPNLTVVLIGGTIWGLGAALGFPMGMSASADDPARAAARTSVVSTIGYTAFIAGPPLLGMLAGHVGFRHAMLAVLIPLTAGLALAGVLRPRAKNP